jgi:hypothetical protein
MQVDSTPPFTSIAQAMGQAAQAPPPPAGPDGGASPAPAQAATPPGVGEAVDVTA